RLGPADRCRIDVENATELRWWSRHLDATPDQVRVAVSKVGADLRAVMRELIAQTPRRPKASSHGKPRVGAASTSAPSRSVATYLGEDPVRFYRHHRHLATIVAAVGVGRTLVPYRAITRLSLRTAVRLCS